MIKDGDLTVLTSLPAQNSNANGTALDLINLPIPDGVQVCISLPALPALANAQTMIVKLQDSADNSSFADVAGLATLTATGAGGVGSAAASLTQRVPLTLRRYVRVNVAASATAGDSTALKATLALAF